MTEPVSREVSEAAVLNVAGFLADIPGDRLAVIDGSNRITYDQLRDRVARTAGGLAAAGLGAGSRICLLAGNEPAFIVGLLGAWHAGATVVLMNHGDPLPQIERYLRAVEPHALLCGSSRQSVEVAQQVAEAGFGDGLVATPAGENASIAAVDGEPVGLTNVEGDDPALLIFTSGVSGVPRPAILSHRNLRATQDAVVASDAIDLDDTSVSLAALPMVHILGLNVAVLSTLRHGGTAVLQGHWSPEQALGLIAEHGIDTLVLVPTMWNDLANLPAATPSSLDGVRLARCGAATLTPEVAANVQERLGIELASGYGLTETAGTVTFEPNARARPGSVGTPLAHVEMRIVDVDDEGFVDAMEGDPGEVWVRGDCVFGGYWGSGDDVDLFTEDGWYRTGDIAVFDDRLYLVGRSKDMISVSGFKISPVEVELCLEEHPAVDGALVVGEPDERTGERVVAYVVASDAGGPLDEDELRDHVLDELARYKVPKAIWVVDELPVNIIGKRVRRGLRNGAAED